MTTQLDDTLPPISRGRIQRWVTSVEALKPKDLDLPEAQDAVLDAQDTADEPPSKRVRHTQSPNDTDETGDFEHPFSMATPALPGTPPLTGGSSQTGGGRNKRIRADSNDFGETSSTASNTTVQSNTKLPKSRPVTSFSQLIHLEKSVRSVKTCDNLADDVKGLSDRIRDVVKYRTGIYPAGLRADIEAVEGRSIPPHYFRESPDPDPQPWQSERDTFNTLNCIIEYSTTGDDIHRHELSWNNLIHTPLLELVFGSPTLCDRQRRQKRQAEIAQRLEATQAAAAAQSAQPTQATQPTLTIPTTQMAVCARFEPVMSASIALPWVPRVRYPGDTSSQLACSVGQSTEDNGTSTTTSSQRRASRDPGSVNLLHTTSKKVDYVVVLDVDDSPVKSVIENLTQDAALREFLRSGSPLPPHINQTPYSAINQSPIAVSIETKIERNEKASLLQLGRGLASANGRPLHRPKPEPPGCPVSTRPVC